MEKFGCTSPFGYEVNNICTDQNNSKNALDLYYDIYLKKFTIKDCLYPCTFMKTAFRSKTKMVPQGLILIFNKFIRVTTTKHVYDELEMIAEIGGYIGLFLGVSVFHLKSTFDKVLELVLKH